jgi:hypothetical protein
MEFISNQRPGFIPEVRSVGSAVVDQWIRGPLVRGRLIRKITYDGIASGHAPVVLSIVGVRANSSSLDQDMDPRGTLVSA